MRQNQKPRQPPSRGRWRALGYYTRSGTDNSVEYSIETRKTRADTTNLRLDQLYVYDMSLSLSSYCSETCVGLCVVLGQKVSFLSNLFYKNLQRKLFQQQIKSKKKKKKSYSRKCNGLIKYSVLLTVSTEMQVLVHYNTVIPLLIVKVKGHLQSYLDV